MKGKPSPKPVRFSWSGFLKLIRFPNLVIIVLTQYMTAVFLVGSEGEAMQYLFDPNLFKLVFSTTLIAAAGYIINDYYDVKIDFINKPERVIVGRVLKRRVAMFLHTAFNFIGIFIGFTLSLKIGLLCFASAFGLWLYSNQLKRLPLIGNCFVGLLTGAALFLVGVYYNQHVYLVNIYAFFAFSITLIREIIKDIEDQKGDADFGCITLPVLLGLRKTKWVLYFLIACFVFIMFFLAHQLGNQTLTIYFLLLVIPVGYFVYYLIRADTIKHFAYLSNFCKIIMLSGVLSMMFF